jgi:hypothetical protein
MSTYHKQAYCSACRTHTLHVSNQRDVPHVLHLLVTLFLCGFWLPVWIAHSVLRSVSGGEPWRCNRCGSARGLFASTSRAGIVEIAAKPAGPSTRVKSSDGICPACQVPMSPVIELGDAVYTCSDCGQIFERA